MKPSSCTVLILVEYGLDRDDQNHSNYFTPTDIEKLTQEHFQKEPENPLLSLDCDEKNVMAIHVDKSMENATETVRVEDGANCTLTIRNSTGDTDSWPCDKTPIYHINYTIFHGDEASMNQNPVIVVSGQTSELDTISFRIMPNCYIEKLQGYVDTTAMYTGSTPTKEAIDWLMDDKSGNSMCENPFFVERYALSVMSFSAPIAYEESLPAELSPSISTTLSQVPSTTGQPTDSPSYTIEKILLTTGNTSSSASGSAPDSALITMPWISTQRQCLWSEIVCQEGYVVSLILPSSIAGSIATELGLLTNLETLIVGTFLFLFLYFGI